MIKCTFPSTIPALLRHVTVSGVVIVDEKVLLVKRSEKSYDEPGLWALPGGYVDRDEKLVAAISREIREETGYSVTAPQLFQILDGPDRPGDDNQNVEFSFLIRNASEVGNHDQEITEVKWWPIDQLPEHLAFDHTETLQKVLAYLKKPREFSLPLFNQISETKTP